MRPAATSRRSAAPVGSAPRGTRRRGPSSTAEHVIESDRVGPSHGPARVAQPEAHPGVDIARASHALAERERALVDDLADHGVRARGPARRRPTRSTCRARRRTVPRALPPPATSSRCASARPAAPPATAAAHENQTALPAGPAPRASPRRTAGGGLRPAPTHGARAAARSCSRSRPHWIDSEGSTPPRRLVRRAHVVTRGVGGRAQLVGEHTAAGDHDNSLASVRRARLQRRRSSGL